MKVLLTLYLKSSTKRRWYCFRKPKQCLIRSKQKRLTVTNSYSCWLCTTWRCATRSSGSLKSAPSVLKLASIIWIVITYRSTSATLTSHRFGSRCWSTSARRICKSAHCWARSISTKKLCFIQIAPSRLPITSSMNAGINVSSMSHSSPRDEMASPSSGLRCMT